MSFWDNKINGNSAPSTIPSRDMFQTNTGLPAPQRAQDDYIPSVRMTSGTRCPGCDSGNYRIVGNSAPTCFECGYNPRFEQSGYGAPSLRVQPGTPVQAARQTNDHSTMAQGLADIANGVGLHA